MEFLNYNYFNNLIENSKTNLKQSFNLSNYNFGQFDFVNSFLIDKILNTDRANLLITTPNKVSVNDFILPATLIAALHCIKVNTGTNSCLKVEEIVIHKITGRVSIVKSVTETKIQIFTLAFGEGRVRSFVCNLLT